MQRRPIAVVAFVHVNIDLAGGNLVMVLVRVRYPQRSELIYWQGQGREKRLGMIQWMWRWQYLRDNLAQFSGLWTRCQPATASQSALLRTGEFALDGLEYSISFSNNPLRSLLFKIRRSKGCQSSRLFRDLKLIIIFVCGKLVVIFFAW